MNAAKKNFAKRLRAAMEEAGHEAKPSVLEREFNLRYLGTPMTLHGVRRWLQGETMPAVDKIQVLADWLGVDVEQLLPGHKPAAQVRESPGPWSSAIPGQEQEIFEAFLALPASQKKIVREVIQAFATAASVRKTAGRGR